MSFEGADVDGLDRLAQEFQEAAQVCNEVKAACEVIVAAASFFGPFGAAFIAYLKGVVIPWLTRIAEALQLMAKVLSAHSQAQQDASSSATSLPTYQTPNGLPSASTANYPMMSATPSAPSTPVSVATATTSYLGGLLTVGTDKAGNVVDVNVGGSSTYVSDQAAYHFDRDAAGNIVAASATVDDRLGRAADPLLSDSGSVRVDPVRDASGAIIGTQAAGNETSSVFGVPMVRVTGSDVSAISASGGTVTGTYNDDHLGIVLGPGDPRGTMPAGALPGGATVPGYAGGEDPAGLAYHPAELDLGQSTSTGSFGYSDGASVHAGSPELSFGGTNSDGLLQGGMQMKAGADGDVGYFVGSQTYAGHTTQGVMGNVEAGAGVSVNGSLGIGNAENGDVHANGGFGLGPGIGVGGGVVRQDATISAFGHGEVDEFTVGGGARYGAKPEGH